MFKQLASRMPGLQHKLRTARIPDTPEYYVKKTFMTAMMLSAGGALFLFAFLKSPMALWAFLLAPAFFLYFLHYADMKVLQQQRIVDQEIVYAGRFLVIELESGVPLYDTFQNLAHNYEHVGKYFQEIVDKINLGTGMEQALNEVIEIVPSDALRKIFWQVLNSLRTGSEISESIRIAIDHIVREQKIAVVEYGRKLNPLAMFYMMMAIILPSLGMTMIIVMATFIGFELSLPILVFGALFLTFVQFMFLAVIRSQRPAVAF